MLDYTGVQKHSGWKQIAQKQTMVDIPKWGGENSIIFSIEFSSEQMGESRLLSAAMLTTAVTAVQVHPEGRLWAPGRGGSAGRRTAALEGARPSLGRGWATGSMNNGVTLDITWYILLYNSGITMGDCHGYWILLGHILGLQLTTMDIHG